MADARKTLILTGASRGIGHSTVTRFSREGWRIITCSRDEVPPECKRDPNWHHHFTSDLTDMESMMTFIMQANELLGEDSLNALVNNAAVSPKTRENKRLGVLAGDISTWRQVFEINFFAPLILARGFVERLSKGNGAIVNITSIAGHHVHPFAGSAYSTSKAALSGLTREMAAEFAALNVRVNAIAPGEIETAMIGPEYQALIPQIPMHKMGEPADVASAVYYLCSDESKYVTGTELFVTGGQHLL